MKWFLIIFFGVILIGGFMAYLLLSDNSFKSYLEDEYAERINFLDYLKAIIINGDTSYNSTNQNTTQEIGFSHLNISSFSPFNSSVLYMNFDSDNSTTAYDFTNYKNNGIYKNGAFNNLSCFSGYGNCLTLDGINDLVDLGNTTSLNITGNLTVSIWIYTNDLNPIRARRDIITKGITNGFEWTLAVTNATNKSNFIIFNTAGNNYLTAQGTTSIIKNAWYQISGKINNTGIYVYLNGVMETFSNTTSGTREVDGIANVYIGARNSQGADGLWNGSIDEVGIFNVDINDSQINDIFKNQSTRFFSSGNSLFQNLNLSLNDTVNISIINSQEYLRTNLSVKINNGAYVYFKNNSILNYNLVGLGNPNSINLTVRLESGGENKTSLINATSLTDTLSLDTLSHYLSISDCYSNDNITLQTAFIASVGAVDVLINGNRVGNISTLDTSPISFPSIQQYITCSGLNNISYKPVLVSTITISSSDIIFNKRLAFYSPVMIGNITLNSWNSSGLAPSDTTPPSIIALTETPADPTTYALGTNYLFNSTITDVVGIQSVRIQFNETNYTASNHTGNVYNFSILGLSAGVYNYYWWANDSTGNKNNSELGTYTINQVGSNTSLFVNNTQANITIVNGSSININATLNIGTGQIELWKNGTLINIGSSPLYNLTIFNTNLGLYNITTLYRGNSNYTSIFTTYFVNIISGADITPPSFFNLTNNPSNNTTYVLGASYQFNVTVLDVGGLVNKVILQFNGTNYTASNHTGNVYNFSILGLSAGVYNYLWFANDTNNNPNVTINQGYTIAQATGQITLLLNNSASNNTIFYPSQINATAISSTEQTVNLIRNNTAINNSNGLFVDLPVGLYNFTAQALANSNYTFATITRWVDIMKGQPPITLSFSPSQTVTTGTQTSVSGLGCVSQIVCNLFRGGASVSNPDVQTLGVGIYPYIFNTTGNSNYTSNSASASLTVQNNPATTITSTNPTCPEDIVGYYNPNLPSVKMVGCLS